ncbi:MAG: tetratricopeptide repeat protein [Candidatus Omnitrophica bacterium]|nr:tetratricopeptide repeat protein [Candidatus Omnitrophota bacterium]
MGIIDQFKRFLSRDKNIPLLLAGVTVLVYFLCLPNQMFWDDDDFILKNIYIQDWQYWQKFFTSNVISGAHFISNYWRPLLQTVFAAEWHLWANWVYGWHAVSIACHAAAAILLFKLLNALLKDRTLSILAALLWVVHPVHTEAVVYPNSLGDSLATIFILGGTYAYTLFRASGQHAAKCRFWWIALLMYLMALLSKETGILLVAFIAITDYFFLTPDEKFFSKARRILIAIWPLILIAVIYLVLRGTVLNFNNSFNFYNEASPFAAQPIMRLWTFFRVMALYSGFIFFPYELRVERIIDPPTSFFVPDVMWGGLLCASLIGLSVYYWKKRPAIAFGAVWFFIAILPTSNLLVLINALIYEHFLYGALIGILIIALTFTLDAVKSEKGRRTTIIWIAGMIILLGIRSAWRCTDWRTAMGFYEQLIPYVPKSYRVANNLGMIYAENNLTDKAIGTYKKAMAIDPSNAVAYHNIANIYRDQGNKELARINYEKAIALQPDFFFSYKSLAQIYLDRNELTKARMLLERYFGLTDEKIYTLNLLTEIAYREGAYGEARRYLLVLLQLQPGNPEAIAALKKLEAVQLNKTRTSAAGNTPMITGVNP